MTPGLGHVVDEVVALARALADAREDRVPAVLCRDVVDELGDDDRLADARPAEDPDLAALRERGDEIDDLDARLEHLGGSRLVVERRGGAMDREPQLRARPGPCRRSAHRGR